MKILVVDDIGFCRASTSSLLKQQDHTTLDASSAEEALEILKNDQTIDAVVTDLRMAGMDGVDLYQHSMRLERVNDLGAAKPPEFILLTSFSPGRNAEQSDITRINLAKQIGFTAIYYKPLESENFLKTITEIEERRGAAFSGSKPERDLSSFINQLSALVEDIVTSNDHVSALTLREELQSKMTRLESVQAETEEPAAVQSAT